MLFSLTRKDIFGVMLAGPAPNRSESLASIGGIDGWMKIRSQEGDALRAREVALRTRTDNCGQQLASYTCA